MQGVSYRVAAACGDDAGAGALKAWELRPGPFGVWHRAKLEAWPGRKPASWCFAHPKNRVPTGTTWKPGVPRSASLPCAVSAVRGLERMDPSARLGLRGVK